MLLGNNGSGNGSGSDSGSGSGSGSGSDDDDNGSDNDSNSDSDSDSSGSSAVAIAGGVIGGIVVVIIIVIIIIIMLYYFASYKKKGENLQFAYCNLYVRNYVHILINSKFCMSCTKVHKDWSVPKSSFITFDLCITVVEAIYHIEGNVGRGKHWWMTINLPKFDPSILFWIKISHKNKSCVKIQVEKININIVVLETLAEDFGWEVTRPQGALNETVPPLAITKAKQRSFKNPWIAAVCICDPPPKFPSIQYIW